MELTNDYDRYRLKAQNASALPHRPPNGVPAVEFLEGDLETAFMFAASPEDQLAYSRALED